MKRIIALLLIFVMCAAFAGCSAKIKTASDATEATEKATAYEPATQASATEEPETEEPETEAPATEAPDDDEPEDKDDDPVKIGGKYSSLSDYLNSSDFKEQFDSAKEAGGDLLSIECYAEGDTLVYDYKYNTTFSDSVLSTMKDSLETALDSTSSTFESIAGMLKLVINDISDPSVKVIYRNGDGSIICEKTFRG